MKYVISNIKEFRKARGMSQAELAEKVGVSTNAVCNYETGKRVPTINHLIAIYEVLSIKLTLTYEAMTEGDKQCQ